MIFPDLAPNFRKIALKNFEPNLLDQEMNLTILSHFLHLVIHTLEPSRSQVMHIWAYTTKAAMVQYARTGTV